MNRQCLLPILLAATVLTGWGCGPEAETGAPFKRYIARSGKHPATTQPHDTTPPGARQIARNTGAVDVNYLTGKIDPAKRPDFESVSAPYTDKPGMFLRRETLEAFKKMWAAAKQDGINLRIISSTRTFDQQKAIWEGKWTRFAASVPDARTRALKILEYSAMPGASRHHWGTDVDLNDLNNATFAPGGPLEKTYAWLQNHAGEYGFCQPYSAKSEQRPGGYNEERWHWSYLPLATPLLEHYLDIMRDDMITGFAGAETAPSIGIVKHYAAGINQACK